MIEQYSMIIAPFAALFLTQFIKVAIDSWKGTFSWKDFDSYGGMPSSHAALLSSAFIESWQLFGLKSEITALVAIISFIVLRDAVGVRMMIGQHAKILNQLSAHAHIAERPQKQLETRVGHTYPQIIVGLLIGAALAYWII